MVDEMRVAQIADAVTELVQCDADAWFSAHLHGPSDIHGAAAAYALMNIEDAALHTVP
jgi:hypothetical protein